MIHLVLQFFARLCILISRCLFPNRPHFPFVITEKENLCLYGHPNEHWEVNLPAEEVPPELPEPVLGINFARDGMAEKDWLSLVAVHSDAWLLAVSFFFGARFGFDKADRYVSTCHTTRFIRLELLLSLIFLHLCSLVVYRCKLLIVLLLHCLFYLLLADLKDLSSRFM